MERLKKGCLYTLKEKYFQGKKKNKGKKLEKKKKLKKVAGVNVAKS